MSELVSVSPVEERAPFSVEKNLAYYFKTARRNLFNSPVDSVLTIILLVALAVCLPKAVDWLYFSAVFIGENRNACHPDAACWIPIINFVDYYIYGPYPIDERWRVDSAFALGVLAFPMLMSKKVPQKLLMAYVLLLPAVIWFLIKGGVGFTDISTTALGGVTLTYFLGIIAMCLSLPVAILLALGRKSRLPIIRWVCILYIELVRAVPVLTFLFMASLMLQLFLPGGVTVDVLFRILFVLIFVSAAYKAEIIRGAIQAVPVGQVEASYAMGCGYWKTMAYVVMPQALRNSVPALITNFIGLFKETTLVMILGLLELMGVVRATFENVEWVGMHTEGMLVVSFFFFIICFSIAQYGALLERRIKSTKH